MEKQKTPWVFPTVKILVSIAYYFMLVVFVLLLVKKILGLIGMTNNEGASEGNVAYVSVSVERSLPRTRLDVSAQQSADYKLHRFSESGTLYVPARSAVGLLDTTFRVLGLFSVVVVLLLLKKIFKNLSGGAAFHPDTVRRLNWMGVLLIAQNVVGFAVAAAMNHLTRSSINSLLPANLHEFHLNLDFDSTWFLGLLILAIAQVYRRGIELQAENELTI